MGVKQIGIPETLLLLPGSHLSGIKVSGLLHIRVHVSYICYVSYESSDIVDSDNFCYCSSCFCGVETIWRSFYATVCLCMVYFFL